MSKESELINKIKTWVIKDLDCLSYSRKNQNDPMMEIELRARMGTDLCILKIIEPTHILVKQRHNVLQLIDN